MPVRPRQTVRKGRVFDVVVHHGGKTIWRRGFATQRLAENAETKLKARLLGGDIPGDERVTVKQLLDRWLDYKEPKVTHHTLQVYRSAGKHIEAGLGDKRVARLKRADIEAFLGTLPARGLNPTSQAIVFTRLREAMRLAVRWDLISRNPCEGVDPPRRHRHAPPILARDAIFKLFDAANATGYGPLVTMAVVTGMRWGELAALTWKDVDEEQGALRIRAAKTPAGVRAVAIGVETLAMLRLQRLHQKERWLELARRWTPEAPVFHSPEGHRLRHGNFWNAWVEIRDAAGLKGLHFHDLRHVSATLLVSLHIHPRVTQERLGHATSKTTLEIYSHVDSEAQREAADAIDALLRRGS